MKQELMLKEYGKLNKKMASMIMTSANFIYEILSKSLEEGIPSNFLHADLLKEGMVSEEVADVFDLVESELYTLSAVFFRQEVIAEKIAKGEMTAEEFHEFDVFSDDELTEMYHDNYFMYEEEVVIEILKYWSKNGFFIALKDIEGNGKELRNEPFEGVW